MNRNSPIPLWLVLCVGVVLLAGVYVLAQRTVAPPQASVLVRVPTALPQPILSVTSVPSVAVVSPSATATPTPSAIAKAVPSDWLTYRNTKYGFEISYPGDWSTYVRGEGEYGPTSGDESRFSISNALPEAGFFVTIHTLGSDNLGPYRAATSVDGYIQLLKQASTNSSSDFTRESVDLNVGGRSSASFQACPLYPPCFLETFFQDGQHIYEISKPAPLDYPTFVKIISTWRFL